MKVLFRKSLIAVTLSLLLFLALGVMPALAAPIVKDAGVGANTYLYGGSADEVMMFASSAVGDVNGDGTTDLVVGHDSAGGSWRGRVYVYYGRASLPASVDLGAQADVTITGYDYSLSGSSVACANVNGDAYADVIIGAWYDSPGGAPQAGSAAVVFGSASLSGAKSPDLYISSKTPGEYAGMSVTSGDIDGDGYGDIVFGAPLGNGGVQFWNGTAWTPQAGANADTLHDVSMLSATDGWAVGRYLGNYDTIYRFNGASWQRDAWLDSFKVNLNGIYAFDAARVWAVGASGTIIFWNGSSWTAQQSGTTADLNDVVAASATTAWAVGDGGVILKTVDGGATWSAQTSGTTADLNDITAIDNSNLFAAGNGGVIRRTTNGGATWSVAYTFTSSDLRGISALGTSAAWAVGDGGTILRSYLGGLLWLSQTGGVTTALRAVCAVNNNVVYAVGDRGVILRTTNGGSSWTRQTAPFNFVLHGVDAIDSTRAWAVGEAASGRVYVCWGRASGWPSWTRDNPIAPNLVINGIDPFDYCGVPLSAGRLNNDARADLVIGASEGDGSGNARAGCGEAYVVLGRTRNSFGTSLALPGSSSCVIYGATAGDYLPTSVCRPLNNVNNDDYDDVILGSTYADGPGEARSGCGEIYVINGRATWPASIDLASTAPNVLVYGGDAGAAIGFAVDALDYSGDGRLDLVASNPMADYAGRSMCGVAWMKYGVATWPARVDLGAGGAYADVIFYGADAGDCFGSCLASGNLNRSGAADLVASDVNGDGPANGRRNCGEHYVFLGPP